MLKLNNLKSPAGTNKNTKRLGRGMGSGQGRRAGKGDKGQDQRTGGGVRLGFEGGTMPHYRRLPKSGFKNAAFKVNFSIVNLETIESSFKGEDVTRENLIQKGLLKGQDRRLPIKILGEGAISKPLNFVNIDKFSKTAKDAILKAGGKIEKR
jgi:large subunit ribosomal protein L15